MTKDAIGSTQTHVWPMGAVRFTVAPFPSDISQLSDHELGNMFRDKWVGWEAEIRGLNYAPIPQSFVDQVIDVMKFAESDDAERSYFAKALSLAGNGKFDKAGAHVRKMIREGIFELEATKWREHELRMVKARKKGGQSNTFDGTRKSRRPTRYLIEAGLIVFNELKASERPVSKDVFINTLKKFLIAHRRDFKYPWKDCTISPVGDHPVSWVEDHLIS